jgi:1-acyl-sn-glycerol-3-phosphate acyltransferase
MSELPEGPPAEAAVSPSRDTARTSIVYNVAKTLFRIICSVFFDLKAYGVRNVPKTGGVLLVSNHQSYLDPVLLGVQVLRPISYLAKSELFANPVFGWLIRQCNAFPVRQGAGDIGAVKETILRLQEGGALNIFPEGSRSEDGKLQPIERGASLVIRRAKVPVVPVVIQGSFRAWPKGRKIFRGTPIRLLYGPPMQLAHLRPDEISKIIESTFRSMLAELQKKTGHTAAKFDLTPRATDGQTIPSLGIPGEGS